MGDEPFILIDRVSRDALGDSALVNDARSGWLARGSSAADAPSSPRILHGGEGIAADPASPKTSKAA
jgi:hypothetical protein